LLIQPLKSPKKFYPTSNINYKPNPGQKRYKRIPFSCHTCPLPLLWHEFDNCLCNFLQSKVSYCLHMHVVSLETPFCPDKSENGQDSDSDWSHIVVIYDCWHCFLVFDIWVSHALEMTIHFYLPNPSVVLFFIYPTFYSLKI
jgi:hypothetical protein